MAQPLRHHRCSPVAAPRLEWAGRDDQHVHLVTSAGLQTLPAAARGRLRWDPQHGDGVGRLLIGDNHWALDALLREGLAGQVDLVYTDPPFNTGRRFEHYDDHLPPAVYLAWLRSRLLQLHALLADHGSLLLHLDESVAHLVRVLLDEIFGAANYRNTIIVKRVTKNLQRQFRAVAALPWAHDVVLLYSKSPAHRYPPPLVRKAGGPAHPAGYWKDFWSTADRPTMRYELYGVTPVRGQWKWCQARAARAVANYAAFAAAGEGELLAWWRRRGGCEEYLRPGGPGKVQHWVPPLDQRFADTLWDEFSGYAFGQAFPTEKSETLLQRVLELFSREDDLVLDCFAGSGTTGAVAARLRRRWILVESGPQALTHIAPRLARVPAGGFRVEYAEPESWSTP
ncbi:MAG: site-specific DNA-methyltransferase [Fimbriimonadaceae bacterium]|nr:site-specific DNA-methyltransferase [Fimbriimonadaceae bacterium]